MKAESPRRQRSATFFSMLVPASTLFGLLPAIVTTAPAQPQKSDLSTASYGVVIQHPDTAKTREEWRRALLRLPKPKTGCYTSAFPVIEWKTAPCGAPPTYPIRPAQGAAVRQPDLRAWRISLLRLPRRAPGCYTVAFPAVEWKTVACGPPPPYPILPRHGRARPFVVGNGANDRAAQPSGHISAVEGSFASISPGLTESGPIANSGPAITDAYTLQINT